MDREPVVRPTGIRAGQHRAFSRICQSGKQHVASVVCVLVGMVYFSMPGIIRGQQRISSDREQQIRLLVGDLYRHPWAGPLLIAMASSTAWTLGLTKPMKGILRTGPAAETILLEKLTDPMIKDQVIILLGGVGDERAIGPIIEAMTEGGQTSAALENRQTNLSANLALTNITYQDIIWPYADEAVSVREKCQEDPKECWSQWWHRAQSTFSARGTDRSRYYRSYPNYGIYQK